MIARTMASRPVVMMLSFCLTSTLAAQATRAGGNVLPPHATPHGWSLDDMAQAVADFSISGNDVSFYPDTPFQILYRRPGNTFTVAPGTYFYLKFFFIDDSPPVVGDWPTTDDEAADYIFGRDQL